MIGKSLQESDKHGRIHMVRGLSFKTMLSNEKGVWVRVREISYLVDKGIIQVDQEALAEYGTFMRKYHASGENRRSRPPMDEQKRDEAKRAMHVVEKTFPLAAMGCQKALTYLFENGISDVNYIGDGGYLHYATAAGRTDMIDFLLKCGADINFLDKDGDTPLRWASANQDTKTVYLTVWHLIDRGADLFVGNQRHGLRPDWLLYDSAKYGDLNRMKKLVEEFHVKPKDAEFFSKILKDTASSKIKAYLEREADRRNWAEAWREEERKSPVPKYSSSTLRIVPAMYSMNDCPCQTLGVHLCVMNGWRIISLTAPLSHWACHSFSSVMQPAYTRSLLPRQWCLMI